MLKTFGNSIQGGGYENYMAGTIKTACGFSVVIRSAAATTSVSERKLNGAKARAEEVRGKDEKRD